MPPRLSMTLKIAAAALLLGGTGALIAQQVEGVSKGFVGGSSGGSFEVGGIDVDVTGKTAEAARNGGWRIAQRKGFVMLAHRLGAGGGAISDGALDSIVTGIIVENEEIGPNRYIARLGVMYDRGKAAAILGVANRMIRSQPMLVIPIEVSGGAAQAFEQKTAWDQAWARFRTGNSSVDYVRASGNQADALLLNYAQTGRRGRDWWRAILDQYGAADVLIPEVRLYRQWPGGPIVGVFTARHGPDNLSLAKFSLRVGDGGAIGALLDAGIRRLDDIYSAALSDGRLKLDPVLAMRPPSAAPVDEAPAEDDPVGNLIEATANVGTAISVQFDTPNAGAVAAGEAALKGAPGVRSAVTTSLALGGISVMRVIYDGDSAGLKAALEARGWLVQEGGGTLRIRRGLPPAPAPVTPADPVTGG
ncbi:hypothetical protein BH09PSE4_BH09PSE4_19670 [soil metagenome]